MNLKFSQQGTYCTLLRHRARGVKFKEDYQGRGTLLKENSLHRCYCCWVLGEADTRSAVRVHVVELWAVSAGIHPVVRVRLLWTCFYTDLLPLNIYTTSSRMLKANKRIDKQLFVLTCTSHFLPCFLFFLKCFILMWCYLQQEAPPQENLSLHKQAACEIFIFFLQLCSIAVVLWSLTAFPPSVFFSLFRKMETSKRSTSPMWSRRAQRKLMPLSLNCSKSWDRDPLAR